jgi:hypothetical protein
MFHTYVAKYFICILHMFAVFLHVFQAHVLNVSTVSYVCCNCFIWMFQK